MWAMTMPYSGQGWRHSALRRGVHYAFNPAHYIGIVIANTTLLYKYNFSTEKNIIEEIIWFYTFGLVYVTISLYSSSSIIQYWLLSMNQNFNIHNLTCLLNWPGKNIMEDKTKCYKDTLFSK
jgi:hypothetical protein